MNIIQNNFDKNENKESEVYLLPINEKNAF